MDKFVLKAKFKPITEQIDAVDKLAEGIALKEKAQVLLGVTGSGKTFTLANMIEFVSWHKKSWM